MLFLKLCYLLFIYLSKIHCIVYIIINIFFLLIKYIFNKIFLFMIYGIINKLLYNVYIK